MEKTEKMGVFCFLLLSTRHSDVVFHLASQPTASSLLVREALWLDQLHRRQNMLRSFDKLKIKYFTTQKPSTKDMEDNSDKIVFFAVSPSTFELGQ